MLGYVASNYLCKRRVSHAPCHATHVLMSYAILVPFQCIHVPCYVLQSDIPMPRLSSKMKCLICMNDPFLSLLMIHLQ